MNNETRIQEIKKELASVPALPGVYLWKDKDGQVIYVGKAKQLRARMKQYVMGQDERAKIPLMLEQIDSFEYIVVENEHESLVLEKNLISQYAPFFNADFKDDKSYPFIAITKGDVFPAIKYTREKHVAGTRYFGPDTDSRAARNLVDIARKVVPVCASKCAEWHGSSVRSMPDRSRRFFPRRKPSVLRCPCGTGARRLLRVDAPEEYRRNVARIERSSQAIIGSSSKSFPRTWPLPLPSSISSARAASKRIDTINSLTDASTPFPRATSTPTSSASSARRPSRACTCL
ncbi:MAG: GIY-YIG nuclease family protein [Slackia sp.]